MISGVSIDTDEINYYNKLQTNWVIYLHSRSINLFVNHEEMY